MAKQSITVSSNNDEWLKLQVKNKTYDSKSDVVNDLISRARSEQENIDYVKAKLRIAEKSGFSNQSAEEIRQEVRHELNLNG